jgi:hypothetical protein
VVTILLIASTLSACTPPSVTVSTGPRETSITGALGGEARGDAGCAWIETSSGERVEVVYPNGWHVEFDPVALFDNVGRRVATEGDSLLVDGYFSAVGASLCTPRLSFNATGVSVRP